VGNLSIAQAIKIAEMKGDSLMGKDLKMRVLEVVGTCTSMGVTIEGLEPKAARSEILAGKFDQQLAK
jgi:large subunit ribosomal protein L11